MSDFITTLEAHGLRPRRVIADGKWYRCATDDKPGKRNGSYKLFPDGTVGLFKNHALDVDSQKWKDGSYTKVNPRAEKQLQRELKIRRELELQRQKNNMAAVRQRWRELPILVGGHEYMTKKGLTMEGCHGVLRRDGEALVVPVRNITSQILSMQHIWPDGTKRFAAGCPVRGGMFWLQRSGYSITVIVEGFATGLAIYQALPTCRVLVCFDAGNMVCVAERLAKSGVRFGMTVVAADNDQQTEQKIGRNPGLEKGQEAAKILGAGIAWPKGIEGSDWNDLLIEAADKDNLAGMQNKGCFVFPKWSSGKHKAAALARLRSELTRSAVFVAQKPVGGRHRQ